MGRHLHNINKLVARVNIKSDGNKAYELIRDAPHKISTICPELVQSAELLSGRWGTVGSVVVWNCTIDGIQMTAKEIIEAVDMEKKSIMHNIIEGEIMEFYKTFKITIGVEDMNNSDKDSSVVTWTVEFEKKSDDVPEPTALVDGGVNLIKGIERYHLVQAN